MPEACTFTARWGSGSPCGAEPAVSFVTFGCVHEHTAQGFACHDCTSQVRAAELIICERCEDGPESHKCPAGIHIRWLA